ncbi:MAG: hypothetical protein KDK53_16785 [Maritimibacter sp.]|nr:hypothetical protein [Maritimibacter sp.]
MSKLSALAVLQDPDFRIVEGPASTLNLGADGPYAYASSRAIAQHAAATWLLEYGIDNCDINDVDPSDFGDADGLASAYPVAYVDADSDPIFDDISTARTIYFSRADLGPKLWSLLDHWASGIVSDEGAFAKLQEFADDLCGQVEEDDPYAAIDQMPAKVVVGGDEHGISESASGEIFVDGRPTSRSISIEEVAWRYFPQYHHSRTLDFRGTGHISRTEAIEAIARDFLRGKGT